MSELSELDGSNTAQRWQSEKRVEIEEEVSDERPLAERLAEVDERMCKERPGVFKVRIKKYSQVLVFPAHPKVEDLEGALSLLTLEDVEGEQVSIFMGSSAVVRVAQGLHFITDPERLIRV